MNNFVPFNQRLWRLPVIISRRDIKAHTKPSKGSGDEKRQRQTSVLAGSIGLNNSLFDLSPPALWEAMGPKTDARDQLQFVVVVSGDMIRDRINDKSIPLYIPFFVN
jgi:hypothetical protein